MGKLPFGFGPLDKRTNTFSGEFFFLFLFSILKLPHTKKTQLREMTDDWIISALNPCLQMSRLTGNNNEINNLKKKKKKSQSSAHLPPQLL